MVPRRRPRLSRWNAREANIFPTAPGANARAHRAETRSFDGMIHFESRRTARARTSARVRWLCS